MPRKTLGALQKKEEAIALENKTVQEMERCLIQKFKHKKQMLNDGKMAEYVEQRFLLPAVKNKQKIKDPKTFQYLQAIYGAAYRTKIPLNPAEFWYVQHQAEQAGATELANYVKDQYTKFKRVHIWLKCNPLAKFKRLWFMRED